MPPPLAVLILTAAVAVGLTFPIAHRPENTTSDPMTNRVTRSVTRTRRYCGGRLTEMLELICQGEYFGPTATSSSSLPSDQLDQLEQNQMERRRRRRPPTPTDHLASNRLPKKRTFSTPEPAAVGRRSTVTSNNSRRVRGAAHDCCDKPCTLRDLSSYCARPNVDLSPN